MIKPGLKTTELYLAIFAILTIIINKFFAGFGLETREVLAMAITSGVYTIARTALKAFTAWIESRRSKIKSKK